jgi:uncharacterized membrane protein
MIYALCLSLLAIPILAFFALAGGNCANFGMAQTALKILVALPLFLSGFALHLFRAHLTAGIIPPFIPARLFLALFTGVCEIAGAIGLFVPRVQRSAALWIGLMMVAIFPANIYSAGKIIDGFRFPTVPVRLAIQIVYIVFVLVAGYGLPARASQD